MLDILIFENPNFKPLPEIHSWKIFDKLRTFNISEILPASFVPADLLVSNTPNLQLFELFKSVNPKGIIFLVTDLIMKDYSDLLDGKEAELLDHVIANSSPTSFSAKQLRVSIEKLIQPDFFGISKYLLPNTRVKKAVLKSSHERESINTDVLSYFDGKNISPAIQSKVVGISEELIINAIFDAPYAAGVPRFQGKNTLHDITLQPEEFGQLTYATDGSMLVISCLDPFGALDKKTLLHYLKKVLKRDTGEDLVDNKAGGAGLGLYKILHSSHGIICNVSPTIRTEVIAIINLSEPIRDFKKMTRSIQFFSPPLNETLDKVQV